MRNQRIILASRPKGMPTAANFNFVDGESQKPGSGEVLLRTLYLSVDPYLRGRMTDRKSYIAPFSVGEVISGGGVAEVVESNSEAFTPGDLVMGMFGWELYPVSKGAGLRKLDPRLAPVTASLGVLGITGLTAYFGLLDIGKPKSGETVVVSGAAGAVGSVVCQIAKIRGCRVVGIAGTDDKVRYLTEELGVDGGINYHAEENIGRHLKELCPKGVDIYFENVGGPISDAVLPQINHGARIVLCGLISQYNLEKPDDGPRPQPYLLINSALMQGFIITEYMSRFPEGIAQLGAWLAEGKLKYAENIVEGFDKAPDAFIGLFRGENLGKQIVKVA